MDQPKLERLLRIMMMLTGNITYTIPQLSKRLHTSERTIYRYIETFREAGFLIYREGDYFRIDKESKYLKDISDLIHFSEEEAYILKSAIENIDETNLIKQNLKKKLASVYNYKMLAEVTTHPKNKNNVEKLAEAIKNHQQIILNNYQSANSNSVQDRLVEPFKFTTNLVQVWCFEPASQTNKLFNIARIGAITLTDEPWHYEAEHNAGYMDIFRIASNKKLPVKLSLSLRAANLLIEEYPLAELYMSETGKNRWLLATDVCSYEGVGRFVLGLYDDIDLIDSPKFQTYLNKRLTDFCNKTAQQ